MIGDVARRNEPLDPREDIGRRDDVGRRLPPPRPGCRRGRRRDPGTGGPRSGLGSRQREPAEHAPEPRPAVAGGHRAERPELGRDGRTPDREDPRDRQPGRPQVEIDAGQSGQPEQSDAQRNPEQDLHGRITEANESHQRIARRGEKDDGRRHGHDLGRPGHDRHEGGSESRQQDPGRAWDAPSSPFGAVHRLSPGPSATAGAATKAGRRGTRSPAPGCWSGAWQTRRRRRTGRSPAHTARCPFRGTAVP